MTHDNLQKEAQELYSSPHGKSNPEQAAYIRGRKKTLELIEKAHKDGYPDHVTEKFKEDMWQQFKKDNGL